MEREEVQENLTRWVVQALARTGWDINVSVEILDGEPGPALVSAAAEATLLVLGSNTLAPSGLPVGSIVEYCRTHSPSRVVVINGCDRRIPKQPASARATAS